MASDEAFRMQVVTRARHFKRSWIDMAEALTEVRSKGLFRKWGYETLHGYALEELNIKRTTCDKLTASYNAMATHVPHVLEWDGVAQQVPQMEAVDYFAKAMDPKPKRDGDEVPPPPDEDVVEELKRAIFQEQASVPSVRKRFNPVLHPKGEDEERLVVLRRALATARRLESIVTEVDGLTEDRVEEVTRCLEDLRGDLDELQPAEAAQ